MKERKVAVVTEAGNDLGKEFAHILLENDYDVILAACGDSFKSLARDRDNLRPFELMEIDFTSGTSLKGWGER